MKQTKKTEVQTWPAILDERARMFESRLKAVQSIPGRICNAGVKETYSTPKDTYYRNDGHATIQSRGVKC